MSIIGLVTYFTGYLTITVSGHFCERFLNVCATRGILLWDIVRISKTSIRCKIKASAFKKISKVTRDTGVTVHISIKHGFPFVIKKYKKRQIALFGVFIFIVVVVIANQFVWGIEVKGNENIPTDKIISVLNESGLKTGMLRSKINQQELKKDALLKIPELAWLWVDKKGSKITVDVREKIATPEILSPDDYYNIVASKDAIIEKMTVKNGVPVVNEGEPILKGTVIVTGKIPVPAKQFDRYTRAKATVLARVWYEKKDVFSKISTTRHETGKSKTHYTLNLFNYKLNLFHNDKSPFKEYDKEENSYSFFGIGFTKSKYQEISLSEEILTDKSVIDFGAQQLSEQIDAEVSPDSQRISFDVSHNIINDSTIEVCVKAEYLEDIAQAEKGEILNEDLN